MRRNQIRKRILALGALALLAVLPAANVMAESGSAPLLAQLTRVYRLASPSIETDGSPAFVRRTLLLVQQPGVVGYDYANIALEEICPAQLEADLLIPPRSALCSVPAHQSRKAFPVDDPVCVTAFRLSEATGRLSIYLIECGAGVRIRTDRTFYAMVDIQLPKETLRTRSLAAVQSEIAKILAPEGSATAISLPDGVESQPAPAPSASAAQQRLPPPLPPLPAPASSATAPAAGTPPSQAAQPGPVALGQTIDQVAAILGAPSIAGIAGGKLIFIYPQRFKIVFLNGKVIEIHPLNNSQ
jgi:hypothetical protein